MTTSQGSSQHLLAVFLSSDIPCCFPPAVHLSNFQPLCQSQCNCFSVLFVLVLVSHHASFCATFGFRTFLKLLTPSIMPGNWSQYHPLTNGNRHMCPLIYFPHVPEASSSHPSTSFLPVYFVQTCDFAHLSVFRFSHNPVSSASLTLLYSSIGGSSIHPNTTCNSVIFSCADLWSMPGLPPVLLFPMSVHVFFQSINVLQLEWENQLSCIILLESVNHYHQLFFFNLR